MHHRRKHVESGDESPHSKRNRAGRRRISRFVESLVRPHVVGKDLEAAYRQMAQEEAREAEALQCAEATVGDVAPS